MKKILTLFMVAIFLLISNKQILACDYYEDESVLLEILETGTYKLQDVTGKICSYDNMSIIPITKGKAYGKVKVFLTSELKDTTKGIVEVEFDNGIKKGLYKKYYLSGAFMYEVNYKNGKREGLRK